MFNKFQLYCKFKFQVFLWVLNTEESFDTAIELGVDGIITDYPLKLINYLKLKYPNLTEND